MRCPLCQQEALEPWLHDRRRTYVRCIRCELVVVPSEHHLSAQAEKAEYDLHRNTVSDPGYRRFLRRLFVPFESRLPRGSEVLDFGCGPGPALAAMLTEAGHNCHVFDPYYAHDPTVWSRDYDGISATEVVEHLAAPGREIERLWCHLKPGGWLGIMTKRVRDKEAFGRWHYKNDATHICFFCMSTFHWLAARWGAELVVEGDDVVLLGKRAVR